MPALETDVAEKTTGKTDVQLAMEESETFEDSSTKQTEESSKTGEVEKTQPVKTDEDEEKELLAGGQSIPFKRFKSFVDKRNSKFAEFTKEFETSKSDLEEIRGKLQNPEVLKAVLRAEGLTDEAIKKELVNAGIETKEEVPVDKLFQDMSKGEDLSTQQGWFNTFAKLAKFYTRESIAPIEHKFSTQEIEKKVSVMENEAKELAKSFNIPYGENGKTEGDPNTAIGKISGYLDKYPEDAGLGHAKLLRLALSEEGFKLGEQAGVKKEKERIENLRKSQMEGEGDTGREEVYKSSDSVAKLMDYARRHPEKIK